MSSCLEQAVSLAVRLPESEQDQVAAKIHEAIGQIADSVLWKQKFADSDDVLELLHDEGLREHQAGRTQPLDR